MAKRKPPKGTPKPGPARKPKPILPASGRPAKFAKLGVPVRQLVVRNIGEHAAKHLDAIKAAMHAAGVTGAEGGEPFDSDAVRFALWIAAGKVRQLGDHAPDFVATLIGRYRKETEGRPVA